MQDEKRNVTNKVIKWLREQGCSVWKYPAGAFGVTGHADVYGVLPKTGRAFFIECKDPIGKAPTKPQLIFLEEVSENNAIAFVTRSLDDCKTIMEEFL